MITLLLKNYTEREKKLLVQCLEAACLALSCRHIEPQEVPALSRDLLNALYYARSEHVNAMTERVLGVRQPSKCITPQDPFLAFEMVVHQDDQPAEVSQ